MDKNSFQQAFEYAHSRLSSDLPSTLTYHSYFHTMGEVLPAVQQLAQVTSLPPHETRLLEIAAVFHDLGYLSGVVEHELAGAKVAQEVLPDFGFSPEEVDTITNLILVTRLPATPTTLLEQIIADADLYILGGEDYFKRNEDLRQELAARGKESSLEEWYGIQLSFMENHSYFTRAAQELYGERKLRNIQELKRLLAKQREK